MAEQGHFGALQVDAPEAAFFVDGVCEDTVSDEGAELAWAHAEVFRCILEVEPGSGRQLLVDAVLLRCPDVQFGTPSAFLSKHQQASATGDFVNADRQLIGDRNPAAGCPAEVQAGRVAAGEGVGLDVVDGHRCSV